VVHLLTISSTLFPRSVDGAATDTFGAVVVPAADAAGAGVPEVAAGAASRHLMNCHSPQRTNKLTGFSRFSWCHTEDGSYSK